MNVLIEIGTKNIVLNSPDRDESIDLDSITTIDYSNLYGEAVTISALLNKVGSWKAEYDKKVKEAKLCCDIYVSKFKKDIRRQAASNGGRITTEDGDVKLTEKGLDDLILLDSEYQNMQLELIELESKRDKLDVLWWAIKSKDQKLNNLLPKIVPTDFVNEIVEGKVNSFLIKKI